MRDLSLLAIFILMVTMGCSNTSPTENKAIKNDSAVFDLLKEHQVLLMNSAEFINHPRLGGASAFLIKYHDKVYAVTAKHLLGEAGGVQPEIKVNELNKYFKSWKLFPRVAIKPATDTVILRKSKLNYDLLKKDILLLEVDNINYNALPLQANFSLPAAGNKLYIIGCPYIEEDCRQNLYEVRFDSYDSESGMLISFTDSEFELAGFSGAPLVNSIGEVVGVVTSGWEANNKFYVGATSIKEIENVK